VFSYLKMTSQEQTHSNESHSLKTMTMNDLTVSEKIINSDSFSTVKKEVECQCSCGSSKKVESTRREDDIETNSREREIISRVNPDLIQIKAQSDDEIKRRIEAFMQSKRNEIDERNIREFISPFSSDHDSSCARVEAIYVHREGGKSHITLKKVTNTTGPQTQTSTSCDATPSTSRLPLSGQRVEALEERLVNMEAHLATSGDSLDVYARIRALEKRIGFLEGLSPEYFNNGKAPNSERKQSVKMETLHKPPNMQQPENLSDINKRIRLLKEVLRQKTR